MIITTSQQAEEVSACCGCDAPSCAAPRKRCESLAATASSEGFIDDDELGEWILHKVKTDTSAISGSYAAETGGLDESGSGEASTVYTYSENFYGQVGAGSGCHDFLAELVETCESSGTKTVSYYDVPEVGERTLYSQRIVTRADVSGTQADDYTQWLEDHPDFEDEYAAWEIAHAAWESEHAAWDADLEAYGIAYVAWEADYAQWEIDHDEWIAGGSVGPEPVEPDPPADIGPEPIEPTEPPSAPAQFYPECWYKDTGVTTYYVGDPPPDSVTDYYYGASLSSFSVTGSTTTDTIVYTESATFAEWKASTEAALSAVMTFSNEDCIKGTACNSSFSCDEPSPTGPWGGSLPLQMDIILSRYSFGVPASYSTAEVPRSVWEMQWDEITAPDEWWAWYDGGMIGTEPTPAPTLIAARDWTWAGSMDSPWSPWFELPIPDDGYLIRPVNVMIVCYHSSIIGVVPTEWGDQVALPEPPP